MHCKHCGFVNGEDDHRCLRCGRRLSGVVVAAPPGYSGANALAPAVMMSDDTAEFPPVPAAGRRAQPTLFANDSRMPPDAGPNVIPFDRRREKSANRRRRPPQHAGSNAARPSLACSARKPCHRPAHDAQGTLDFIPAAPLKGRKLKTDVDAQVFCDQPVATPTHRFVASAIDGVIDPVRIRTAR